MIMIERTTQNKIAKNDYWDYGMQGQIQDSKKEGAQVAQGSPQRFFGAYLSQFRGLFKEFSAKTGGRAPPLDLHLAYESWSRSLWFERISKNHRPRFEPDIGLDNVPH